MKIENISLTNWLTHRSLNLPDLPGFTLVCGSNERGKTSVLDAIEFAMTGDCRRIDAASQRETMVSSGAKKGFVVVAMSGDTEKDGGVIERDIASGKAKGALPPFPARVDRSVLSACLHSELFASLDPKERRKILLTAAGVSMGPKEMIAELHKRKHPKPLVDELETSGAKSWQDYAREQASAARGAWKEITKETYGAEKGETWMAPAPPEVEGLNLDATQTELGCIQLRLQELNRELGSAASAERERGEREARRTRFERIAMLGPDAEHHLTEANAKLPGAEAILAGAQHELSMLDGTPQEIGRTAQCPYCARRVFVTKDGLQAPPDPLAVKEPASIEQFRAARARMNEAEAAVTELRLKISAAQKDKASADHAQIELDNIDAASGAIQPFRSLDDINADIAAAKQEAAALQANLDRFHEAQNRTAFAADATERARDRHLMVKQWSSIADDVAPGGIPSLLLGKALGPINATLAKHADATGWRVAQIGEDMSITVAGRPYGLLSESAQWRADAMIAASLSAVSGFKIVTLDRFDVLDLASRGPCMTWLYKLTKSGTLSTVILAGTLKAPPAHPADSKVVWLDIESTSSDIAA